MDDYEDRLPPMSVEDRNGSILNCDWILLNGYLDVLILPMG